MRDPDSHKGDNGRVLVIGGSDGYVGAPGLAGVAALRSGADIVRVAAPEKVAWALNEWCADLITEKLPGTVLGTEHLDAVLGLAEDADVVLIGNGLGRQADTLELVEALVSRLDIPLVLDADALHAIRIQDCRDAVLTPHHGELRALLEASGTDRQGLQKILPDDVVVLVKGRTDHIIAAHQVAENDTGSAAMTVGGTGDVLAGIIAGLRAQGMESFTAARRAAHVLGLLGQRLSSRLGDGLIASDILPELAEALAEDTHF